MALQLWFPLNKNEIKNQGLKNTTLHTSKGPTYNSSGKIGGCFSFSNSYIYGDSGPLSNSTQNFSIAFWVNYDNLSDYHCMYQQRTTTGEGITVWKNGNHIRFDDGSSMWETNYTFTAGVWTHVCVTRNTTNKKLYINGELKDTGTSGTLRNVSTKFVIGKSSTNVDNVSFYGNIFYGKLNDFRVYDHCLSEDEIHELSLGKVGHWCLNDYEISRSGLTSVTWNQQAPGGFTLDNVIRDTSITTEEKYIVQTTKTTSNRCLFKSGSTISTSHKAFIRVVFKSNFTNAPYLRYQYASNSYKSAITTYVKNQWCKIVIVSDGFVQGMSTGILAKNNNFIQGEYISIADWIVVDLTQMFGSGNEPTAEQFDEMFPLWGTYLYDAGTIKDLRLPIPDISGNHYDLTANGNPTLSDDSVRYDKSCQFGSGISLTPLFPSFLTNEATISMWVKLDQLPPSSPGRTMLYTTWQGFSCEVTSEGRTYFRTQLTSGTVDSPRGTITAGNWTHWVGVKSSTGVSLYLNGTLVGTASNSNNFNWSYTSNAIGAFSGSYWTYGKLSDVRLYATALSADDVQKLYKLGNV